jgi:hypothetical protein
MDSPDEEGTTTLGRRRAGPCLFARLRDYLVRVDDEVPCARCHRRVEIPSHQSIVFL